MVKEDGQIIPYNMEYSSDYIPPRDRRKTPKLDYNLIYKLSKIHCNEQEIADILGINVKTLANWKKEDSQLAQALTEGFADYKITIRRAQLQIALPDPENGYNGNARMLEHLGKTYCGQNEVIQVKQDIKVKLSWGNKTVYDNTNTEDEEDKKEKDESKE